MTLRLPAAAVAAAALVPFCAFAQTQVVRPPIATYGVDVGTRTMSIPGMPAGGMGGLAGAMMPAGMGGPQKELWLGLRSTQKATGTPEAQHMIPPGMGMGPALPLLGNPPATPGRERYDDERPPEKPKARMLIYWGCGDIVRPGQPKIADTEKMDMVQFGQAFAGRSPPERWSAQRNAQLLWPNEREKQPVPANARLAGDQLVKGNATPDIRFAIGEKQDFMPPMEVSAGGGLEGPTPLSWAPVANAQGYFLQAMGFRQSGGEMILWTSSELQDTGFGLMNYLPNDFLRKMIDEKVVLPPATTSCAIPKGIFEGADGAMVNSIAYGEELNLMHPPRPTDPKVAWEQVWAVKVRVKSTGMSPLGMGDAASSRGGSRRPNRAADDAPPAQQQAPAQPKPASPLDDATDTLNKMRKLLPF
jgi:hypothetical protein